jgi:hypothetical protein
MIEDIKVVQRYGWVELPDEKEKVWGMTAYMIMIKREGEWSTIPVEHVNPQPPEEANHEERKGSA